MAIPAAHPRKTGTSTGSSGMPGNGPRAGGESGERVAPHSLDAEQGLLASCLMENGLEVLNECLAAKIRAEFFYRPAHQLIYEALVELNSLGIPPEEIVLANRLQEKGQLDAIGGHGYLFEISNRIQTTVHSKHWMDIVREKYFVRRLIRASTLTVEKAHDYSGKLSELLNDVESEFFKIQQDNIGESAKSVSETIDPVMGIIHRMLHERGKVSGVPSGFIDLDALTFGFHPGEMIVVAARPSMGKTSIALNMAEHAVLPAPREDRTPSTTLLFSLEMTADQLALRLLCSHAGADMQKLREGFCDRQRELAESAKALKQAPLWIDASANVNILEMRAKARRLHARHPINLVIIDYLQLVSSSGGYNSREQEVAEVSRNIKAMAQELKVPVIVLCQLNREAEKEKRLPRLSDLRESGSIEQDADVVLLLSKPRDSKDGEEQADQQAVRRELIIAKNRNGPTGEVALTFIKRLTRFENYTAHAS